MSVRRGQVIEARAVNELLRAAGRVRPGVVVVGMLLARMIVVADAGGVELTAEVYPGGGGLVVVERLNEDAEAMAAGTQFMAIRVIDGRWIANVSGVPAGGGV